MKAIVLLLLVLRACVVEGTWSVPPTIISTLGPNATQQQIALSATGRAVALWQTTISSANTNSANSVTNTFNTSPQLVIKASIVAPSATVWSVPAQLSLTGFNGTNPQIGIDSLGRSVAIWQSTNSANTLAVIRYATLPATSTTWNVPTDAAPHVISVNNLNPLFAGQPSSINQNATTPDLAMNGAGHSVALWASNSPSAKNFVIQSATLSVPTGTWSAPITITYASTISNAAGINASLPKIAIDALGNAVAVWVGAVSGTNLIYASTLAVGATAWTPAVQISPSNQNANTPQIAFDGTNAIAVWMSNNGSITLSNSVIQASILTSFASNTWSTAQNISLPLQTGATVLGPQIAMDSVGNAYVVWQQIIPPMSTILSAIYTKGAAIPWSSPILVNSDVLKRNSFTPQVAIVGTGTPIALWALGGNSHAFTYIESKTYSGGIWGTYQQFATSIKGPWILGPHPQIATNTVGKAVSVWGFPVNASTVNPQYAINASIGP